MLSLIIVGFAVAMIAKRIHTTSVYLLLFVVGAVLVPALPALQLTILSLAMWMMIECAVEVNTTFNQRGTAFGWRVGNLAIAYCPQTAQ